MPQPHLWVGSSSYYRGTIAEVVQIMHGIVITSEVLLGGAFIVHDGR